MIKGQIVSGDFSKIVMRVKAGQQVELGELLVVEDLPDKYILQAYDLLYSSHISSQNLELVACMSLEEGEFSIMDEKLRNYQLALLKPLLKINQGSSTCKKLPGFFNKVREIHKEDLSFVINPTDPITVGNLRVGSQSIDFPIALPGKEVLSHHVLIPASTGKGKSNLMSCILWDLAHHNYSGLLVLDPHDEYYGRTGLGLKDHPNKQKITYYTPSNPPPGARSLVFNIAKLKPEHFQGAISLSDPQRQCLHIYYKKFKQEWIYHLLAETKIEQVRFHEDTLAVVKRKLISLLGLEFEQGQLTCSGIFELTAGENTITDICLELERGKIVIIDTSYFGGALEILIGTIISSEIFERYKFYKKNGQSPDKPVISIVLEEAPRVLGKKVLEEGSNIFETIAREGRKFNVGLIAITQLPSEIPKNILANMNTKIILGLEMGSERQAVIESSPQDLSQDGRNIASLDKGEALITSTFTKFAIPVKIPLFKDVAKKKSAENISYPGITI